MGVYKFDFENLTPEELESKEILLYINHVIFEVAIENGFLVCNNCGKEYKIYDGIANMVLGDEEV
jgi:uncharacterized protein YbaR (Trm112 family)